MPRSSSFLALSLGVSLLSVSSGAAGPGDEHYARGVEALKKKDMQRDIDRAMRKR